MAINLEMATQRRVCAELKVNHHWQNICTWGRYLVDSHRVGVPLEQKAALTGMAVHPLAKSDRQSEHMNSVVQS